MIYTGSMDIQIQQAVEIALNPRSDPAVKQQAFDFINQVKSSPDGWKHCVGLLDGQPQLSNETEFFIFQVSHEKIPLLDQQDLLLIKGYLTRYLTNLTSRNEIQPVFLRNALAKSFGLLFYHSYLTCYSGFFKDILALVKDQNGFHSLAVDYYLRILLVIHSEIGDNLFSRERASIEHNNQLKDGIRSEDMALLTSSWRDILAHYSTSVSGGIEEDILLNAVACIGGYVSWMEIQLILDNALLETLYQLLASKAYPAVRVAVATTFVDILAKKMVPAKKIELLKFVNLTSAISCLESADLDLSESLGKLVNAIGLEAVISLENSSVQELSNVEFKNSAMEIVVSNFPLVFRYLENAYDDVSQQVFPFIAEFLLFLKKNITNEQIDFGGLNNIEILTALLEKVIVKMKFDEDDDGIDQDALEAFTEVRKKLKSFQDSILFLTDTAALDVISTCIDRSLFQTLDSSLPPDWRNIELGLFELTNYSELLRNNVLNLPKTMINNSQPYYVFNEMLCKVIDNAPKILVNHQLIQLLFFELIVKHSSFFVNSNIQVEGVDKQHILLQVLKIFISNFGLFNDSEQVKLRSWYIFYRFIKLTNPSIQDATLEELLGSVLPLLQIRVEGEKAFKLGKDPLEIALNEEHENSFTNQLYLFEAVGLLVSDIPTETKEPFKMKLMEVILQPLFTSLEKCVTSVTQNADVKLLVVQAHHCLMSVGTFIKGFEGSPEAAVVQQGFLNHLQQVAQVVIIVLETFIDYPLIRGCSRFTLVRLFNIFVKVPTQTEGMIEMILTRFISMIMMKFELLSIDEIIDFIHFIQQVLHAIGNLQNVYQLLNSLVTPLFGKILEVINTTSNDEDSFVKSEKSSLKRAFVTFLINFSNNHLTSILISDENQEMLCGVINHLLNFALDTDDVNLMKLSVMELSCLIQHIGGGVIIDVQDTFGMMAQRTFKGAEELLIRNSVILSFEILLKNNKLDFRDAQVKAVFLEVGKLLKALCYMGSPPEVIVSVGTNNQGLNQENLSKLVRNDYQCQILKTYMCGNLMMPEVVAEQLLGVLVNTHDKEFVKGFMGFVGGLKRM